MLSCLVLVASQALGDYWWAGKALGVPVTHDSGESRSIGNESLEVVMSSGRILKVQNDLDGTTIVPNSPLFQIVLADGRTLSSLGMQKLGEVQLQALHPTPKALKLAEKKSGSQFSQRFLDFRTGLQVDCRVSMRDGANYVREEVTLTSTRSDLDLKTVILFQAKLRQAAVVGTVPGSPIVAKNIFLGVEHPMATNSVAQEIAEAAVPRKVALREGQSAAYSAVIGVSAPGQLRRSFAAYVERERARPYEPFLHYNSWYDLGFFNRYTADQCVDRINTFGTELVQKRGVKLQSFLFDDGWDDTHSVWNFNKDFPNGMTPLREAAAKFHAAPGMWLSPWGGYGTPREERLAAGNAQSYEIDREGFALSGQKYYQLFHKVCLDLVGKYGVNQFKFDGTGSPDKQVPGSAFDSDFDAAIQLIADLRVAQPSLFINLTTGTWPSPFWLGVADSIWRGGYDHSFTGVGSNHQKWMTYRDGDTYHGVVKQGPLYPLNSLMLHGIIYAQHADRLQKMDEDEFRRDVHAYFGNGTQLQEMYITPSLLSAQNWDDLAEAAKWSWQNRDTLRDSHWIGGDPVKLQVYGWAATTPGKAIVTLRNPSDKAQAYALDLNRALELSAEATGTIQMHSPWKVDAGTKSVKFELSAPKTDEHFIIKLAPFEVLNLEGNLPSGATSVKPVALIPKELKFNDADVKPAVLRVCVAIGPAIVSSPALQQALGAKFHVLTLDEINQASVNELKARNKLRRLSDIVVAQFPTLTAFHANDYLTQLKALKLGYWGRVFIQLPAGSPHESAEARVNRTEVSIPIIRQLAREFGVSVIEPDQEDGSTSLGAISDALTDRKVGKAAWKLVSADSEQADDGPARMAFDGDPDTFWHTQYSPTNVPYPHELVVDMSELKLVRAFRYLPRQDGGQNGRIKNYEFYLSEDGKKWGDPVATGQFASVSDATLIQLKAPVKARYFKFRALSEQNGKSWASCAELDVVEAK